MQCVKSFRSKGEGRYLGLRIEEEEGVWRKNICRGCVREKERSMILVKFSRYHSQEPGRQKQELGGRRQEPGGRRPDKC